MTTIGTAAKDQLKDYLERVERIESERKEIGDDLKAVYAEAKSNGFDTKAIKAMVRRRAREPHDIAKEETILDTYMMAVGMISESPLYGAVAAMGTDTLAREQVIDAFLLLVPVNGEIIVKVGGAPMRLWRDEAGQAHSEIYAAPTARPAPVSLAERAGSLSIAESEGLKYDPIASAVERAERRSRRAGRDGVY